MFSKHNGMKLVIYKRREFMKFTNMWDLNNKLLNNQWARRIITGETKKYSKMNAIKTTTYQNLQMGKSVLRGKFRAVNANAKKDIKPVT